MTTDRTVRLTPDQLEHKKGARRLIRAVGGVEAAATYCRAGKSQLSDYGNPNVASFMPSDVIADLEANTVGQPDHPIMTRILARMAGDLLVKPPRVAAGAWGRSYTELAQKYGELSAELMACLTDDDTPGKVTGTELRDHRIREILAVLAEVVAEMDALALCTINAEAGR